MAPEAIVWRVLIFPKGNGVDHLSIYLAVADARSLPPGWTRFAHFRFTVKNQFGRKHSIFRDAWQEFNEKDPEWGFIEFIPLSELHDPKGGFILNDACLILVEVDCSTDGTSDLLSHEFVVETDSNVLRDKLELEIDNVRPALKKHKSVINKPEDDTKSPNQPLPTALPSSHSEVSTKATNPNSVDEPTAYSVCKTIESDEEIEKDIDMFYTSLESELANQKTVSFQEEAMKALAKTEEALNMAPVSFYETGKFSSLKNAFMVLSSFECSAALMIEQKTELLAMEENFKLLTERVAKAVQEKNLLSDKESVKLTLTRNLEKSLNIFKEIKENFKATKDMKMELEAIGKEWPEYEAKAKAADEELKTVAAEWKRMKAAARPSMSSVVSVLEGRVDFQELVRNSTSISESELNMEKMKTLYQEIEENDADKKSMLADGPWTSSSTSTADLYPLNLTSGYWQNRDSTKVKLGLKPAILALKFVVEGLVKNIKGRKKKIAAKNDATEEGEAVVEDE
ncbi:TRAF-like protein [Corchorus capsularis]|uniref:TRAF-like protein n=1 Tax=Corchorus capsularis TaxID=210143 RepID=A0A1R3HI14_COCAP|nr:TRAF-like protein [Corchorus capsularis]